jgi:hypothetical protein
MTFDPHVVNFLGGSIFIVTLGALLITGHYYGFGIVLLLGLLFSLNHYYNNNKKPL